MPIIPIPEEFQMACTCSPEVCFKWNLAAPTAADFDTLHKQAGCLCTGLIEQYGDEVGSVAIITPYSQQVSALRTRFERAKSLYAQLDVFFGTVDGYQVSSAELYDHR